MSEPEPYINTGVDLKKIFFRKSPAIKSVFVVHRSGFHTYFDFIVHLNIFIDLFYSLIVLSDF